MRIGIIGIGNIGGTLARKLVAAGHEVRVANSKGVEGVQGFANEIGATAADVKGAVDRVEAVILSIPFPAVENLPEGLFSELSDNVPVIDTGNYYPGMRDPQIALIDIGQVESLWVAEQIGRPVIKAFNSILAESLAKLGRPSGSPDRLGIAVAGDDAFGKQLAMKLVDEVGFDAVDGGQLEGSWRLQPAAPAYCCDYDAATIEREIATAEKDEIPPRRDALMKRFTSFDAPLSHDEMVALNRDFSLNG